MCSASQRRSYSQPTADHPSNKLLMPLGIIVSADTASANTVMDRTNPPSQLANVDVATRCLEDTCRWGWERQGRRWRQGWGVFTAAQGSASFGSPG